ncbi:MAG: PorP/SprF family type IX secretion system membrane protein [Bacteroidales bacterium]|nr:PorP/SprF family type IX secretion system membrane protein [Bacteroidales bacterium]
MHRLLAICFLSFLGLAGSYAQDPQFSQFYSNPLYLAPSFAGAAEASRICANFRDQWIHLPAPFVTYSFSYDHYFSNFNSGIGFLAYKDAAGSGQLGTLSVGAQYSYNFKLFQDVYARPGLHFSYREHGLAWDKLTFIDEVMYNGGSTVEIEPIPKVRDVDLALSALVYSKRVWAGVTVDHILTPNVSFYADKHEIPVKVAVFGGVELVRRGRLLKPLEETMTLAYLFKHQGPFNQLDVGVYWHKNPMVLGLWYRGIPPFNSQRGDAFIVLVGYKTKSFNVGYSYDVTISNLIGQAIGSHEISLSYKFAFPRRSKKGEVPCPEF